MAPKDVHETFFDWAISNGVHIHKNIKAAQIPGKGIGILAEKRIKEKEEPLIRIPRSTLVTIDSAFVKGYKLPTDITVHGTLAAAWTLNRTSGVNRQFEEWESTWPSLEDVTVSMPLFWESKYQKLLPAAAQDLLKKQQAKYDIDWSRLSDIILSSGESEITFKYYWMLVNSRCYYWLYAKSRKAEKGKQLASDECLALCPYADYFNHSSTGSAFYADPKGVSIVSNREYEPGEEIVVTYGQHGNDFLLLEYGFTMDDNEHESITLDKYVLSKLPTEEKALLESIGYLGNYGLHDFGPCYRTEIALRSLISPESHLLQYLQGQVTGRKYHARYVEVVSELLEDISLEVKTMLRMCKVTSTPSDQILRARWKQMQVFLKNVKLES